MADKLWTDEEQRLAERAMRRREQCVCGHFLREHGQNGTCWATVWPVYMTGEGGEVRPGARYCPCLDFASAL